MPLPPLWLSHLMVLDGETELENKFIRISDGGAMKVVTKFCNTSSLKSGISPKPRGITIHLLP